MKNVLKICVTVCLASLAAAVGIEVNARPVEAPADSLAKPLVYVVDLQQDVNSVSWLQVKLGVAQAVEEGAEAILFHMNTYGGEVLFADSIRTLLLNTEPLTAVFIDPNAASAGALISIACDRIYMRQSATIGASTVVDQSGSAAPDKYQSYMRGMIRATAEATGRDPRIAEAMVDPDVEVPGVSEKGKVLTFTASEAMQNGFCDAIADSLEQIVEQHLGYTAYDLRHYEFRPADRLKGSLMGTSLRALLIVIIVAGIWFELQSPGIGFPSIAALVAAALYFAPLYFDGLVANWELVIFLVGIVLLALEILVIPGFGVAGVLGVLCLMTGLSFALVENDLEWNLPSIEASNLGSSVLFVFATMVVSVVVCLLLSSRIGKGPFRRLALEADQPADQGFVAMDTEMAGLVGREGIAETLLRPGGKIRLEGRLYDAVAEYGFIEPGKPVRVNRCQSGQLYVIEIS